MFGPLEKIIDLYTKSL